MLRPRPHAYRRFLVLAAVIAPSCFDRGTRWEDAPYVPPPPPICETGVQRCAAGKLERCTETPEGAAWTTEDDCASQGLACAPTLLRCTVCIPDAYTCNGQTVEHCHTDGEGRDTLDTCDTAKGVACREGACKQLCVEAGKRRSNVGCEYWAVDLDNAMIDATSNAAAQQFAVVVSNAQPDVAAEIHIFQDDGAPGDAPAPVEIQSAVIAPLNLQVFKLGPREVDGSPEGEYNTGSHTALTRHAFKITSNYPVVAYQFNPLENVNVFSNDASLLKPREALAPSTMGMLPAYVVLGWPQTIAATDDPNTNFNPLSPIHLRSFLTIVGMTPNTTVRVHPTAMVVGGGPVAQTPAGGLIEATVSAFDVLNLETGDFNADFTGTIVEADGPIAVFSGGEASDAPHFDKLSNRRCCADHLEDQLDPLRTAGKQFVVPHSPSRTRTVLEAGAKVGVVPEPDYVRFVAASSEGAVITTTLPVPNDTITLSGLGDYREVTAYGDFMVASTGPINVGQVMGSQDAAGVKRGLPGGDPSLLIVPPVEQYRSDYVFLTPDKYAFDFVWIVAAPDAAVLLDEAPIDTLACESAPGDGLDAMTRGASKPPFVVYRCQLGFATIDPLKSSPDNVSPGVQNDGVHRVTASRPVGVFVSGFDSYVSYAYAAGTELEEISIPE